MAVKAPLLVTNQPAVSTVQSARRAAVHAQDQAFHSALSDASAVARRSRQSRREDAINDASNAQREDRPVDSSKESAPEPTEADREKPVASDQDAVDSEPRDTEPAEEPTENTADSDKPSSEADATEGPEGSSGEQDVPAQDEPVDDSTDQGGEQTDGGVQETTPATAGTQQTVEAALLKALETASRIVRPVTVSAETQATAHTATNTNQQTPAQTVLQQSITTPQTGQDQSGTQQNSNTGTQTPTNMTQDSRPVPPEAGGEQSERPKEQAQTRAVQTANNDSRSLEAPTPQPRPHQQPIRDVRVEIIAQRASEPTDAGKPASDPGPRTQNLAVDVARLLTDRLSGQAGHSAQTAGSEPGSAEQSNGQTNASSTPLTGGETMKSPPEVRSASAATSASPANAQGALDVDAKAGNEAIDRIVRVTQATVGQRTSQVRLQLDPPELGQVRIDVKLSQGTLSISLQVESQSTRDLLQSRFEALRQGLAHHGLQVDRFDIEMRGSNQTNQHSRDGQAGQQPGQQGTAWHQGNHDQAENFGDRPWKQTLAQEEAGELLEVGTPAAEASDPAVGVDLTA